MDQVLTREELAAAVEEATGSAEFGEWVRFSWGSYLKAASFRGLICFAPNDGNKVRFHLPADLGPRRNHGGRAPGRAARYHPAISRGLRSRVTFGSDPMVGGTTPAPARLQDDRRPRRRGGRSQDRRRRAWVLTRNLDEIAATTPVEVARLLPAFDPWTIGAARHVPALLNSINIARIYRNQGWISPVVLVSGGMDGVWKHTRKGSRLLIEIEPFANLPRWAKGQLEIEAERMATFYDCSPRPRLAAARTPVHQPATIWAIETEPAMTATKQQRKRGQDPAFPRLLGERLCLDLANTIESPRHKPEEFLHTYDDLIRWGHHTGILTEPGITHLLAEATRRPTDAAAVFARALTLRSAVTHTFRAIARDEAPAVHDLDRLRLDYAAAITHAQFAPADTTLSWSWDEAARLDGLLWPIAHSAVTLLTSGDLTRVKECPGANDCGWLFYDTSKNGSRRWCSMEGCGSRVKMRRLYARSRPNASS